MRGTPGKRAEIVFKRVKQERSIELKHIARSIFFLFKYDTAFEVASFAACVGFFSRLMPKPIFIFVIIVIVVNTVIIVG